MRAESVLLLLSVVCGSATAGDWPHWRGPDWNGTTPEEVPAQWPENGPTVVWEQSVGIGFSSVSVAQGRAYTMGNTNAQDTIWCCDAAKGDVLWKHTYPARLDPQWYEGGPTSTPTVSENRVFTLSKWGDVFCLDAATGAVVWQRDLGSEGVRSNRWGFAGSPFIYGKLVILNAGTTGMALDRDTGRTVWSTGTNVTGYATPVLWKHRGQDTLLLFAQKHLVALDPAKGHEFWRYPFQTGYDVNNTDPIIVHDRIFITSYSRGCALLQVLNGQPQTVYTNKNLSDHLSPGILQGEYLYSFSGEAHTVTDFRCLHVPTGTLKWTVKDPKFGSVISPHGKLLILTEKGELQLAEASPAGLRILARSQILSGVCWTPPTLANARLYARNAAGRLGCWAF